MQTSQFFSKILLFGEYGIIKSSKGLSIPYDSYSGFLSILDQGTNENKVSHNNLSAFSEYLKKINNEILDFDWEKLENDLANKLFFDSNIPKGYGVGSSGAIVAAFYDRYILSKKKFNKILNNENLIYLKNIFGRMESFFHGKSSGLDPLNSYLNSPILIKSEDQIETTKIPTKKSSDENVIFLLDTGFNCETEPMVSLFMDKMQNKEFSKIFNNEFIVSSNKCIEYFLKGEIDLFFINLKKLSSITIKYFKPMIPEKFHELWNEGIKTNDFYFKLCGSGGGGYILGFSKDQDKTKRLMKNNSIEVVSHF